MGTSFKVPHYICINFPKSKILQNLRPLWFQTVLIRGIQPSYKPVILDIKFMQSGTCGARAGCPVRGAWAYRRATKQAL